MRELTSCKGIEGISYIALEMASALSLTDRCKGRTSIAVENSRLGKWYPVRLIHSGRPEDNWFNSNTCYMLLIDMLKDDVRELKVMIKDKRFWKQVKKSLKEDIRAWFGGMMGMGV